MLRAFLDDATLTAADARSRRLGYRTHEFGDSVFIEKRGPSRGVAQPFRAA